MRMGRLKFRNKKKKKEEDENQIRLDVASVIVFIDEHQKFPYFRIEVSLFKGARSPEKVS
jgi:hypothetical protein